jgi:hypothetical protein
VGLVCTLIVLLLGARATAAVAPSRATPMPAVAMLAVNDLKTVVHHATAWLVGFMATLATFFLTLGGARYMAANGDPSEVERAKTALKNAGIGYAIAILAPGLLKILQGILGV